VRLCFLATAFASLLLRLLPCYCVCFLATAFASLLLRLLIRCLCHLKKIRYERGKGEKEMRDEIEKKVSIIVI